MKANILGTEYEIVQKNEKDDPYLLEADGYCDTSTKKIVVRDCVNDAQKTLSLGNLKSYEQKVTRHELLHAFLYESGLSQNCDWADNEEVIDFFAIQFPKIQKVFKELNTI